MGAPGSVLLNRLGVTAYFKMGKRSTAEEDSGGRGEPTNDVPNRYASVSRFIPRTGERIQRGKTENLYII